MKILVTGASGFIGASLVRNLIHSGHELVCFVKDEKSREKLEGLKADFMFVDLTEREQVLESVKKVTVDSVFHLAGVNPLPLSMYAKAAQRLNVQGMKNLVDACLNNTKHLIYVQGTFVFANCNEVVNESTPRQQLKGLSETRNEAEKILWEACKKHGLPATVAILGDVYGHSGWFGDNVVKGLMKNKASIPGKGDYFRSFVHVEDAIRGLIMIAEKMAKNDTYIICDDEPATFGEFVDFAADILRKKRPRRVSAFLVKMTKGTDLYKFMTYSVKASNKKIKKELGFRLKYPTYREGLQDILTNVNV